MSYRVAFGTAFLGGICILIYELATDFYGESPEPVTGLLFPALVLISKFGITLSFTINYLAQDDLFPVLFVSTAYGLCNFLARFFTIFSPQVAEIQSIVPITLFVTTTGIAMITSNFLIPKEEIKID